MAVLWTISWASALNSSKLLYFPSEMFCRRTEDTWKHAEADGTWSLNCFYWCVLCVPLVCSPHPEVCGSVFCTRVALTPCLSCAGPQPERRSGGGRNLLHNSIEKCMWGKSFISTWFRVKSVRQEWKSVKRTLSFMRPRMNFRYVVISCLFKFFLLLPC